MSNIKKIKKIILCILIPIIIILIPFVLLFILHLIYPKADVYLLTGFSFYSFISFFLWLIIISIIISKVLEIKENKRKILIKEYIRKEYITIIIYGVIFVILIFLGGSSLSETSKYYKDIKDYPQDTIMSDVTIEKSYNKSYKGYYITGYIDGKKTKLELTGDAKPDGNYIENAKKVKIYYYKNIKEVYKITYLY